MMTKDEAMKLALQAAEVLEKLFKQAEAMHKGLFPGVNIDCQISVNDLRKGLYAAPAIREALAEQPAQQEEPPDVYVVVARAVLKKLGIDDDVIDTIAGRSTQQPAQQQEPVYWQWRRKDQPWSLEYTFNSEVQLTTKDSERRALYTSPQPAQPSNPLTDEEIESINVKFAGSRDLARLFARAIEAAHGIKEKT